MNDSKSIRRGSILLAISANPGISKRRLMTVCGIGAKALEMHLARIVDDGQAYSAEVPGQAYRAWYPGESPKQRPIRVSSVFDLGLGVIA